MDQQPIDLSGPRCPACGIHTSEHEGVAPGRVNLGVDVVEDCRTLARDVGASETITSIERPDVG